MEGTFLLIERSFDGEEALGRISKKDVEDLGLGLKGLKQCIRELIRKPIERFHFYDVEEHVMEVVDISGLSSVRVCTKNSISSIAPPRGRNHPQSCRIRLIPPPSPSPSPPSPLPPPPQETPAEVPSLPSLEELYQAMAEPYHPTIHSPSLLPRARDVIRFQFWGPFSSAVSISAVSTSAAAAFVSPVAVSP
ncbi:unnamed protein product [Cuscuta campestris]|uniref:Uncharacterized protein n=1 Tax=Cuscuta campestris TaxID=132261 RepID=A0A484LJU9_9ASTE|nr:unnamed protein product [Cuscuta campestris]